MTFKLIENRRESFKGTIRSAAQNDILVNYDLPFYIPREDLLNGNGSEKEKCNYWNLCESIRELQFG